MTCDNWRNVLVVGSVQVLSQSLFFAQGILSAEELVTEQPHGTWFAACAPLFYGATQHLSGVWWQKMLRKGNRWTTVLGAAIIAITVALAAVQDPISGQMTNAILGGIGMGLIALQLKPMKYSAGSGMSLWGVGVTGIGLALWPSLTCFFVKIYGPKLAFLPLAGITLHAVPVALLLNASDTSDQVQRSADDCATIQAVEILPDVVNLAQGQYTLIYRQADYETRRIRPSNCVEVMPGIPEESEHESDHNQNYEEEGFAVKMMQAKELKKARAKRIGENVETSLEDFRKPVEVKCLPFSYTIFTTTILLRLGDDLCLSTVISVLPIFATSVMPQLPIGEKAMLMSLCGFSRMFTEWPLLAHHRTSKSAKFILCTGPILACVGWYLLWRSETLDAIAMASISLGVGSGAATTARRAFAPEESPNVENVADIAIGIALLATIPCARLLIINQAIREYFLFSAGIYAAAYIAWIISRRRLILQWTNLRLGGPYLVCKRILGRKQDF